MSGPDSTGATRLEYAAARLANAVAIFLRDRDPAALTGLKLTLSEYRQTEQAQDVRYYVEGESPADGKSELPGE